VDWDSKKISSFEREDDGVFPSPYSDIDDICERVSILRIAMNYTNMFPEKRGGHFWKGKCPLPSHNDKDPSFWVNTRTGLCGCFGNCELNGNATNVIGLYAKINGITYGEAIKILKDM
jgi:DNA primase